MKTKDTFKKSGTYISQVSVVVIGIAITFALSNLISIRNQQKELERYLEMVKMELNDNLEIVQLQFNFYDRTGKLAKYLHSCGKQENIQEDSLTQFNDILRNLQIMVYKTSAFEMLKSSGTMRLIKDKNLIQSIWDCYSQLEYAKNSGDREMEMKNIEQRNAVMENGISEIFKLWEPKNERMFNYYAIYTATEGVFRTCELQIKKTLAIF